MKKRRGPKSPRLKAKTVFERIVAYYEKTGGVGIRTVQLAEELGYAERTVRDRLSDLRESGHIRSIRWHHVPIERDSR